MDRGQRKLTLTSLRLNWSRCKISDLRKKHRRPQPSFSPNNTVRLASPLFQIYEPVQSLRSSRPLSHTRSAVAFTGRVPMASDQPSPSSVDVMAAGGSPSSPAAGRPV
jgi:hypothetical protein